VLHLPSQKLEVRATVSVCTYLAPAQDSSEKGDAKEKDDSSNWVFLNGIDPQVLLVTVQSRVAIINLSVRCL
jgi:hypothetical protein